MTEGDKTTLLELEICLVPKMENIIGEFNLQSSLLMLCEGWNLNPNRIKPKVRSLASIVSQLSASIT